MLKLIPKPISIILLSIALLSSCSSWFGNKTIEYQEEVKLSDGSSIWVDIKRHYTYVSAIGQGSGYKATRVEISWDTGFQGIGRQTLEFDGERGVNYIDKQNNLWYIYGSKTRCSPPKDGVYEDKKCVEGLGTRGNHSAYLYVLSNEGFLKQRSVSELTNDGIYNILDTRGLRGVDYPAFEFNSKQISWQQKLQLQQNRIDYGDIFGLSVKELHQSNHK